MNCAHCGATLPIEAKYCPQCGASVLAQSTSTPAELPEQSEADSNIPEGVAAAVSNFSDAIQQRMAVLHDRNDQPLGPLRPGELSAFTQFLLKLTISGTGDTGAFRAYIELPSDCRKTVVALVCILPLLEGLARERGHPVYYATAESSGLSAARIDYRGFHIVAPVEFVTWAELGDRFTEGRLKAQDACIIGDLDWKQTPLQPPSNQAALFDSIDFIMQHRDAAAVLFHQVGLDAVRAPSAFQGM